MRNATISLLKAHCRPISYAYEMDVYVILILYVNVHMSRERNIDVFEEINSFGWYNDTVKNSSITTKHLYLILTFRSRHEIFIRNSWYSVLPSLDATISCRIKKAVVGVTQLITALVSIHIAR